MRKNHLLRKRIFSIIMTLIMVVSMMPANVFADSNAGDVDDAATAVAAQAAESEGTEENPYLIGSAEDLENFRNRVNKGETSICAKLTADINLNGDAWIPIGTSTNQYTGTFDGNGHKIRGLTPDSNDNYGLFGVIATGGTVQDLFLEINKQSNINKNCGFLANTNHGIIRTCSVELTTYEQWLQTSNIGLGLIVYSNFGTIESCYASAIREWNGTFPTWLNLGKGVSNVTFAGFAYENKAGGIIKNCFFRGYLRHTIDSGSHTSTCQDYAITASNSGTVKNSYCFNPNLYWGGTKCYYLYNDEQSGYGYGDIGVHYENNITLRTQDGSLTWKLNEEKPDGPWRLHREDHGSDCYPTLYNTDCRVIKKADGSYKIEEPHYHDQVEFTNVYSDEELRTINEGHICLGDDITLTQKWEPQGDVKLCLNGHKIYTTKSDYQETPSGSDMVGYGIDLNKGAKLTLLDCSKETGWIGGAETAHAIYAVTVNEGGTFNMEAGCINYCDTGVIVKGGTFKMTGGEIKGSSHIAGIEYRSGALILGGHARVADNMNTGSQNVLLIQNSQGNTPIITFEKTESDARFGISVGKYNGSQVVAATDDRIAVTGEACQEYYQYLFADRLVSGYDYGELYLGEKGIIEIGKRAAHSHCVCGAAHTDIRCEDTAGKSVGHLKEEETEFQPWDPYTNMNDSNPTLPTDEGNYYLTRSVIIESDGSYTWEPKGDVKLCLNGHTITYRITSRPVDNNYPGWIRVSEDSALTVTDCSNQGTVICDNQEKFTDRWINAFRVQGGTLNLYGGIVKKYMKAVYVESGTLNMYGGTLTENCSSVGGGGVYVNSDDSGNSGTLNMYGGKISGNMATGDKLDGSGTVQSYYNSRRRGGGVYVNRNAKGYCGTFNMYGGEISGNGEARGLENDEPIWCGGGVYAGGNFTMTGGKISGNTAAMFTTTKWQAYDSLGGGVYVGGDFTMTGGEITNNSLNGKTQNESFVARGGGVYVGGDFTMTGGTISGNKVTSGVGGGVYVGGTSNISGAYIEKNEVSYRGNASSFYGAGGGIFASSASNISESTISENKVTDLTAVNFKDNSRCSGGGGVFLRNTNKATSTITNCTITGNTLEGSITASQDGDRVGGGGVLVANGTLTVEDSTITGNTMTTTDDSTMLGGGILCYSISDSWTKGLTLKGAVKVKENTSGGNASNLCFEGNFAATVGEKLTGGKHSIGVTKTGAAPILIAKAAEGYKVSSEDVSCFFDDSGTYVSCLASDSSIQLTECQHDGGYTDGKCTACGYECPHTDIDETLYKCKTCQADMVAKVTLDGTVSYYAEVGDAIKKAADGSEVTLLASTSLPANVHVTNANGIILDLNGKSLSGQALNVGDMDIRGQDIKGKLTVKDSSNGNGQIGLEVKKGGTLVFDPGNNKTKITQLVVYGGDVKLYGGRILGKDKDNLQLGSSVKMTDLLPVGYAYRLYSSELSYTPISYSNAAKNDMSSWASGYDLIPELCDHTKLESDFNGTNCPYCNSVLAATVINDNQTTGYPTVQDAVNKANGGTVKLLADAGDIGISSVLKLDCNGHTITKLEVKDGVTLADLLPEGYAFKSNGEWVSDLSAKTLDNVTNAEAPIKSVKANNKSITVKYGESYTLSTTFEWTGDPDSSDRLIKWAYKGESEFSSTVPTLTDYTDNKRTIDYSISLSSKRGYPAQVGTHTYVVTFTKDGYSKSCEFTVTVEAKALTETMVGTIADQTYDGSAQTPEVTANDGETNLKKDKDYSVSYTDNTNAGEAKITITGIGNYTGTVVKTFTIKKKALSADEITVASGGTYDGKAKTPEVTVKDGDKALTDGTDYTLEYTNNTNAGTETAKVTITGQGNYAGTVEKKFSIAKAKSPVAELAKVTIFKGLQRTYYVKLPALPKNCGSISYTEIDVDIGEYYKMGATIDPQTGMLVLPIENYSKPGDGAGYVWITAATTNYEDCKLTIEVIAEYQTTITGGAPILSSTEITYGDTLNTITLSGSMKAGDKIVEGTFSWKDGTTKPAAGKYSAEWIFTPNEPEYKTETGTAEITVNKANLTGVTVSQTGTLKYTEGQQAATVQTSATSVNNQEVTFTYSDTENGPYDTAIPKFTDAGEHTVYYKASAAHHNDEKGSFIVTIDPAAVTTTDTPTQDTVYAGTEVSKVTFKDKVTVTFNSVARELEGTWSVVAKDGAAKFDKAGKYTCIATFTPDDKNFAPITIGDIEITVINRPSGGGGGVVIPTTEVVTKDKTTTSPGDVKTETKIGTDGNKETISKVTVSDANQKEIIKQVKDNKSEEIIINVSDKDIADDAKLEINLDKEFIDSIVNDTDAKLTIKTPAGDRTFTKEELKELSEASTGDTITIDPTDDDDSDKAEKIARAKELIAGLNLTSRSSKTTKRNIKVVLKNSAKTKDSIKELKELGFTVKYRFYRSTKKSSGYKSMVTKNTASYINTKGKKGTKYYYKVRVMVYDADGNLVAQTELKQCSYGMRTWSK